MFNPYGFGQQPIVIWPQNGQQPNEMDIKTYFEIQELLEKKAKEKKDTEKKKPEPHRFSMLECIGLAQMFLLIQGGILLYVWKHFLT